MTTWIDLDSFAGGGGASTGLRSALEKPVDIAINHSEAAIAMHAANHPETHHYCESIWTVNPKDVCRGKRVRVAWFSPDCTHHSRAKGGQPRSKEIRDLADTVIALREQLAAARLDAAKARAQAGAATMEARSSEASERDAREQLARIEAERDEAIAAAVAAEREACARLCIEHAPPDDPAYSYSMDDEWAFDAGSRVEALSLAAKIRARGGPDAR